MNNFALKCSVLLCTLALTASANDVNKRIRFARGATQATVSGNWHPDPNSRGETFDRYFLGASKGQRVTVTLKATGNASLFIWQDDYNNGELASGSGKSSTASFKLPKNGDFNVDVGPSEGAQGFDYSLTVSIL